MKAFLITLIPEKIVNNQSYIFNSHFTVLLNSIKSVDGILLTPTW